MALYLQVTEFWLTKWSLFLTQRMPLYISKELSWLYITVQYITTSIFDNISKHLIFGVMLSLLYWQNPLQPRCPFPASPTNSDHPPQYVMNQPQTVIIVSNRRMIVCGQLLFMKLIVIHSYLWTSNVVTLSVDCNGWIRRSLCFNYHNTNCPW